MQDIEEAPIDKELSDILQKIVNNKKYDKLDIDKWSSYLLLMIKWIKEIEKLSVVEDIQNEKEIEVHKKIQKISKKITKHLNETFDKEPPFTIVRLAELIIDPTGCGYSLNSNKQIIKYFNSLERIILVSSSISNYPEPTFGVDLKAETSWKPATRKQNAVNVELVEIPWLKSKHLSPRANETAGQKDKIDKAEKADKIANEVREEQSNKKNEIEKEKEKEIEKVEEGPLVVPERETNDMQISPPLQDEEKTPLEGEKITVTSEVYRVMQQKSKSDSANDFNSNNELEQVKKRPGSSGQENLTPTKKSKNVDEVDENDEDNMEISQSEITDV